MPPRRYDLLALDVDGTLLDSRGRLSEGAHQAVRDATDAGVLVCVCTGRGLVECRHVVRELGLTSPVIVAGGSIVADPASGRTLHRVPMHASLVGRLVSRLHGHGLAALVLKDPDAAGFDYLVVTGDPPRALDPVTLWWFEQLRVEVRFAAGVADDPHPEQTVRVGACLREDQGLALAGELERDLGDAVTLHSFPAVVAPEHTRTLGDGRRYHILEAFDRAATKWSGVSWLAASRGIPPERVCAIGDEVNDVSMIRGAGLGVAMGNAVPEVLRVADRVTRRHDEGGVAHAVRMILSGAW